MNITRALLLGTALLGIVACSDDEKDTSPVAPEPGLETYETTLWTADQVNTMTLTPDKSFPVITELPRPKDMPGYWVWDTWPVLLRDNTPARINGQFVLISLTAPDSVLPGKRHDIATYRYMTSTDGENWKDMGELFTKGSALGSRQWAGSTIYDPASRKLTVFYTASGERGETQLSYTQRMAQTSATLTAEPGTVKFGNWEQHRIILTPDLKWYAQSTGIDTKGIVFAFRDPSFFRDPRTGKNYLTFTGRIHGSADQTYNGNVGIAEASDENLSSWKMMKPLIAAPNVNAELERPIALYLDNRYYLIISTHLFTFKPPLKGPEGMYGWTAPTLFGPWTPMNGSGLMLHNPASNPDQTYSYQMLQDRSVLSFVNYIGTGESCGSYTTCGNESAEEQTKRFGGTLANSVIMNISGATAKVAGQRAAQIVP